MDYDYHKLLKKAIEGLPEKLTSKERFQIPQGDVFYEGNTTILKNFTEIANLINREGKHFFSYLLKELGTAGGQEGERAIFQGKIPAAKVQSRIQTYVENYVLCKECHKPDTYLVRENRTLIMRCEACGAFHPVKEI
jgi:translation initiation factor 2 subunit 2